MKKDSKKKTRLLVTAADASTEITVIDNQFRKRAKGLGALDTTLTPGIYKLRWKTGNASEDKLFEITGEENNGVMKQKLGVQTIQTSAPLSNTTFGHLDKPEILADLTTGSPSLGHGKACEIMIFLRDRDDGEEEFTAGSVTLHDIEGRLIADFKQGIVDRTQRYAGLNIGVDPGVYGMRVETGDLGVYECFVFATAGWQTRVFLTYGRFYSGENSFRRPMLRTMSVLMGRIGEAFNPGSQDARLAEVALNALMRGYDILGSEDMKSLLDAKFEDPMLGIYGAHLLLQKRRVDWELYEAVCRNLLNRIGPVPDVQALFVQNKRGKLEESSNLKIYHGLPPLLVKSWNLLVKHSKERYSTIPRDSFSDLISGSVVSSKPWLMRRVEEEMQMEVSHVSFAMGERVLKQMAQLVKRVERERLDHYLKEDEGHLNPIENAILNAVLLPEPKTELSTAQRQYMQELEPRIVANRAISGLQVPSYTIARSAVTLATKLDERFGIGLLNGEINEK